MRRMRRREGEREGGREGGREGDTPCCWTPVEVVELVQRS